MHKKCSGITGRLTDDPNFCCQRCLGLARPIDQRPCKSLSLDDQSVEVVDSFCYLGDTVIPGGGCEASSICRIRVAWGKFHELLPILTSKSIPIFCRGMVYNNFVRSAMLYASECWPITTNEISRIRRTDRSMMRWICGVKLKDHVPSDSLLDRLLIPDIEELLRTKQIRWFGHVERSSSWINKCTTVEVPGNGRGSRKKKWRSVVGDDLKKLRLSASDTNDCNAWRYAINERMRNRRTRNSSTQ